MESKPIDAIPYYNNIFVEFDMLIDTDYGLIRFINENFADERLFMVEVLDEEEKLLKGLLRTRLSYNPLIVPAIDESNIELLDKLYNEFKSKYHEEIIINSCATAILELCRKCLESETYTYITVICNNKYEENIIKEFFSDIDNMGFNTVISDDEGTVDVRSANTLFVKYSSSLIKYSNLDGKSIYLADLNCNINMEILKTNKVKYPNPDGELFFEANDIKFITMYPYDNSYSIEDDFEEDDGSEYEDIDEHTQHKFLFEDEDDVTEEDIELLKEWLTEEELYNDIPDDRDIFEGFEGMENFDEIRVSDDVLDNSIFNNNEEEN